MYRFIDVPVRPAAIGVTTRDLAAGECLPIREAPAGLIADGSAVVLPDGAGTRPVEARAR
jgi:hypothetical protein